MDDEIKQEAAAEEEDESAAAVKIETSAAASQKAVGAATKKGVAAMLSPARLAAMKASTPARVFQSHWWVICVFVCVHADVTVVIEADSRHSKSSSFFPACPQCS